MKFTEAIKSITPKALKKGDTIGITLPSSACNIKLVSNFAKTMEEAGFKILLGETVTYIEDQDYNSAGEKIRATDFNRMVTDNNVSAIWAGAGGFGAQKVAEFLDYDAIKKARKPIIGFSDTTYLLNAISQKTGLVTFLGPTAEFNSSTEDALSVDYALNVIMGNLKYPHEVKNFDGTIIRKINDITGTVTGRLVGGNLTMLQVSLGTDFEIDTEDKILLIEEVGESSYTIERMLDHLEAAGKFENPAAVVFGEFSGVRREQVEAPHSSNPSVFEILVKKFADKKYPVLVGYNFSHGKYNLLFGIGSLGKISNTQRTLQILDSPVAK